MTIVRCAGRAANVWRGGPPEAPRVGGLARSLV